MPERNTTMFTSNASTNSASISAPKFFRFNILNDTIEGSEFNFKMSGNPTKPQYEALMTAMAMQPTYTLAPIASTKKVDKKQTYAGLTLALMADYIRIVGSEQAKAEFNHMVEDKKTTYPTIKSWFLDYFKVGFTVEKAKREIANRKLNTRKAVVRKVVKASMVKAAPAADAA